jgi:hypothetical protein
MAWVVYISLSVCMCVFQPFPLPFAPIFPQLGHCLPACFFCSLCLCQERCNRELRSSQGMHQVRVVTLWPGCLDSPVFHSQLYFYFLSSLMSWSAVKQWTIALSSTEAEYYTIAHGMKEGLWMCLFLASPDFASPKPFPPVCNNQGACCQ